MFATHNKHQVAFLDVPFAEIAAHTLLIPELVNWILTKFAHKVYLLNLLRSEKFTLFNLNFSC